MIPCFRGLIALLALLSIAQPAFARDVAFIEPGSGGGSATPDEAFKIEPKSDVDIGESIINIVRRQTLFFVNQTSAPIKVEKMTVSSDSTVSPVIVNDDCSKQSTLPPLSRCSVELTVTPTGPGAWGIELLMTHNGPGRITRAKITGKTAGSDLSDKRDRGLFLSTKDAKPVEFGDVTPGSGKVVRSALMVNDSPSPITIYSIDVIEADKTLQRLDQGCSADMDLKPGESCPVTLVWTPATPSTISTDLIIRHSGQLGFAVVPIRGTAKGADGSTSSASASTDARLGVGNIPVPVSPNVNDVARELVKALPKGARGNVAGSESVSAATGEVHLIGTVGNRAVLLLPNGTTSVVQSGDQASLGGTSSIKVVSIGASSASVTIDGKKKELRLEAVQELKDRAMANRELSQSASGINGKNNPSGGGGKNE